jgi:glyoxylase-like metal-dependent hydrolase (beta-lactamase superfamily II)
MIDAPVVPSAAAIWQKEIEKHGPLRYVINNEPHVDHFGGSSFFECPVIAHEEARDRMASTPVEEMIRMLEAGAPESLPLPDTFRFRLPEITFSENLTLHMGDHTFEILRMPGHTACQTVVYVPEEKTLFAADTIVNRRMPSLHEALPFEWLDALDKLRRLDIELVVPGHGLVGDARLVDEMAGALGSAVETVKGAVDAGMTLGEAKDRLVLFAGYDDFISTPGFRRWLNRVNVGRLYLLLTGSSAPFPS